MSSSSELRLDIEELEELCKTARRPKVKDILLRELVRLRTDEVKLQDGPKSTNASEKKERPKVYTENITNYAWDQSDKFMKLYLSLDSLSSITDENLTSTYTEKSVKLTVKFSHKHSNLNIARLCEEIVPTESYAKIKSDYVLVMLKKKEAGKTWACVTGKEKDKKDKFKDMAKDEDPAAGLQNMLKNMYDEGDDEMKRTIAKAMYESQTKQRDGVDPLAGM